MVRLERKVRTPICISLFLLAAILIGATAWQSALAQTQLTQVQRVRTVAQVLASTYDFDTGLFRGTGWWNSANGITALANVSRDLRTQEFDRLFENTYQAAQHRFPGFLNEFYDDEGWWALAWLDVFELRGDRRYLAMAQSIFTDMTGGWSDTCGGGIWWKKNEHYKNAIANELFLSVGVRLAELSTGANRAKYLDWARREERWFMASGMINDKSLVNDGLDASCKNNGRTTWSYNQGVLLRGLAEMNKLTRDAFALQTANNIARAVSMQLTDSNGILHDPCEPNCGEDGVQFKGILIRNLVTLVEDSPSGKLTSLIRGNANSVWGHARTGADRFSVSWSGPPQNSGTGSLISALDALTAPVSLDEAIASQPLTVGR
jgi:predicted alpha-1,6-mannanase (GH76 family)